MGKIMLKALFFVCCLWISTYMIGSAADSMAEHFLSGIMFAVSAISTVVMTSLRD